MKNINTMYLCWRLNFVLLTYLKKDSNQDLLVMYKLHILNFFRNQWTNFNKTFLTCPWIGIKGGYPHLYNIPLGICTCTCIPRANKTHKIVKHCGFWTIWLPQHGLYVYIVLVLLYRLMNCKNKWWK